MDLHGIREALVIEQANQAGYRFDEIIVSLPFPFRVRKSYYIRKNLPFTYPLPKRIDETFQGRTGLLAYDLIVISGVDIHEFSPEEQLNLISYVEHGGSLIFTGGSFAFEKSDGTYHLLKDILPVEIRFPEKPFRISGPSGFFDSKIEPLKVKLNKKHPVCKGLSDEIGFINILHPLKPKKNAEIIASAGKFPVIIAGKYENGRIAVITARPDYDNLSPVIDMKNFFEHVEYDDLVRNLIMWLLKKEKEIIIKKFSLISKKSGLLEIKVILEPGKEKEKKILLEVYGNNLLKQAQEREVDFSEFILKKEIKLKKEKIKIAFKLPKRTNLQEKNFYKIVLTAQYGKDINREIKNMMIDPYEPVLHRRDTVLEIKNDNFVKIKNLQDEYVFMPGQFIRFEIKPYTEKFEELIVEIEDERGKILLRKKEKKPCIPYIFEYEIPEWKKGLYILRAKIVKGKMEYYSEYQFAIVNFEPFEDLLFIAPIHVDGLTEKRIYQEVSDRINKGFNCVISGKVMGKFPERFYRNLLYYRYLTQFEHNLYLWGEYEGLTCFVDHGPWYIEEGKNPNIPCVLSEEFRRKTIDFVKPIIERAEKIPLLLSMEILDEPHVYPANVCRCNICLGEFLKKYGYKMPKWSEIKEIYGKERYDFFDFLGDYYRKAFSDTYNAILKFRKRVKANHVFALIGAGQYSTNFCYTDDFKWFPYCDTFEFDCYNYMYGHFAGAEKARFHQFHFAFARYRNLANYYKKEIGFFVQTDDRDYPHDIEPIRAPVEILYTAIGQNAKTFHLMYKPTFSNVFGLREERWEIFGKELKKIRNVSPLIKKLDKPSSPIAMFFPYTNWVVNPPPKRLPEGYVGIGFYHKENRPYNKWYPYGYTPFNSYEFLFRYFGECDVIDERIIQEGKIDNYKIIFILGTDYIHSKAAEIIENFVKNGGIAFFDKIPSYNQNGEKIDFMKGLKFLGEEIFDGIEIKFGDYGNGKVYLLTSDLDELYTDILISEDKRRENLLKQKFQEIIFRREGIFPNCLSTNPMVEGSLLKNKEFICITVVNHSEKTEKTIIKIFNPDYDVKYAIDLITFEKLSLRKSEYGIEFDCELEGLNGRFIGLYENFPDSIKIEGKKIYNCGDYFYLKILPVLEDKILKGEFLARIILKNPDGRVECDKIISINSSGYIIEKKVPVNEINGLWSFEVEFLHSGISKKFIWEVK